MDGVRYEDRESTWVQFERGVFYERVVGDRLQVLQSYPIALRHPPRGQTYHVRLNADELVDALASVSSKYANVKVDSAAYKLTLVRADLLAH